MTRHFLLLIKFIRRFPVDKFEQALDLYILHAEQQLTQQPNAGPEGEDLDTADASPPFTVTDVDIEAGLWLSRKQAWNYLEVVRSTLEYMLKSGELPSYRKIGDEHKKKPRVWLLRSDVEEHFRSYTLRKGKEHRKMP